MNRKLIFIVFLVVGAFALGLMVQSQLPGNGSAENGHDHAKEMGDSQAERWTCSMHPQIILPTNDQKCPICFMDLVPLDDNASEGLDPGQLALSEAALALADVETKPAHQGPAHFQVRLVGQVSPDETRIRTITSRVAGRLDRLFVDATGQLVSPGMKLADIYSPQLFSAQAELRAARGGGSESAHSAGGVGPTEQAVINRLRLWGLEDDQIESLMVGNEIQEHLTVRAPTGGVVLERRANQGDYVQTGDVLYRIADLQQVWVTLDAFEADLTWLGPGQDVEFVARALPGRSFQGQVLFINPVLDPRKRTAEVRIQVENTDGLLKPGMLVSASVAAALDAQGQRLDSQQADQALNNSELPLLIPATAPLLTGQRAVVYVKKQMKGQAVFEGRQVVLGPKAGGHYIVLKGLMAGDEVVTRGAFKIDSALQIQAQPSMMSFAPLPEGFAEALQQSLTAYFILQEALGADDDPAALAALPQMEESLALVQAEAKTLASQDLAVWAQHEAILGQAMTALNQAEGIEPRRLAFEPLSDHLWAVAESFGQAAGLKVYRFNCPMAMDGRGANWMQDDDLLTNPYYGSAMLRCGTQVGVLQ